MKNQLKDTRKELIAYKGPDQIISSFDLSDQLKYSKDMPVIASKIPLLDYHLEGGFEGGELISISGPPKTGKTLLAQSLTLNFLDHNYKSLWFQYEVTPKRFLDSFGSNIPMFYLPQKLEAYNLPWIETRILEAILKQGIKIVFIDHLHYLFDLISSKNTSLQIGSVIRTLKQIAVKYNIIIFLLCHMKKVTFDKEPSDEDIRDSSLIGSESDTVLIIWRTPKTDTEAILKLRYARRSGARDKKIKLVKIDGVLRQTDHE